jgi:hypothetical protein
MDANSIDASIGLEFSLELFKAYKASGTLQALFIRVPGIQKNSLASLQLVEGAVVACFIEERSGQRLPVTRDMLIQLDNERGPFEWKFRRSAPVSAPLPVPPVSPTSISPQPVDMHLSLRLPHAVPRAIARLNWIQFRTWSYEQRQAIYLVWQLIDGKRTLQEIQIALSDTLSVARVNEVVRLLIDLKVINLQ